MINRLNQEMVSNCLQGNENAWEEFIRSHERRIYSMSYRFTRCRAEAEDMTQDVFIRVFQTLNTYRAETCNLGGWLMRVARNLLIDRYRKARREMRLGPIGETEVSADDSRASNPLESLARHETTVMVHAALQKLSADCQKVIVLHDLKGLDFCDVAAILRVPVGTVKSRVFRGRRELARILRGPADRRERSGRVLTGKWHGPVMSRARVISGNWHSGWGAAATRR